MNEQPQDALPLAARPPQERSQALERYRILQPCVEHDMPLTHVARHHGLPLRTVQRWLAQYRRDGFAGLARRQRSDRRQPHGLPPELTQMIEGLALRKPPPTVALVHRQVRDVALRNGWPVPNYHRVYRVMKHLDPALVTLAHDGSKIYRTTYDLLYRREAEKPNDIWQADHTLLDIWVRHDDGPPVRPWLTVIMDDYSRAVAGFGLSFQAPSAIQTALILHQAIWRKSLPQWKITGIPQYLRHLSGVDRMIDPPKCSHLGHHLINKNGIGHCRKQLSCVDHLWLPAEPRFESVDAACWPRSPHRPHEGMGDIDHAHGQIGTLIHRLFMDVHDVCEFPILLRVSTIARQLEAQPIRVASWIIPQRHVTPQEYDLRCFGGLQRRCDHHDHRQHGGKLLLPQRPLVSASLSLVLDTRGLQVL